MATVTGSMFEILALVCVFLLVVGLLSVDKMRKEGEKGCGSHSDLL